MAAAPLAVPPAAAAVAAPGQAALALTARHGEISPWSTAGWSGRIYSDKPDATGAFKLIREERTPTPNIALAPGSYVVHVGLGLVSAVRPVTLRQETTWESFDLPAGGLRIEGRVGSSKIPAEPDRVRHFQRQPV